MYSFSDRHIGINNLDKTNMLDYVGSKNIEELISSSWTCSKFWSNQFFNNNRDSKRTYENAFNKYFKFIKCKRQRKRTIN